MLISFSFEGIDNANKVLISQVLENYTNGQPIEIIAVYREKAVSYSKGCNKFNYKAREMYAKIGLNYNEVRLENIDK